LYRNTETKNALQMLQELVFCEDVMNMRVLRIDGLFFDQVKKELV